MQFAIHLHHLPDLIRIRGQSRPNMIFDAGDPVRQFESFQDRFPVGQRRIRIRHIENMRKSAFLCCGKPVRDRFFLCLVPITQMNMRINHTSSPDSISSL